MKQKGYTKIKRYQKNEVNFRGLSGNNLENCEEGIENGIWGVGDKKGLVSLT